jgi:hypothetical protein
MEDNKVPVGATISLRRAAGAEVKKMRWQPRKLPELFLDTVNENGVDVQMLARNNTGIFYEIGRPMRALTDARDPGWRLTAFLLNAPHLYCKALAIFYINRRE